MFSGWDILSSVVWGCLDQVSVALMRSKCLRLFMLFEFVLVLFKLSSLFQSVSFVMFKFMVSRTCRLMCFRAFWSLF